MKNIIIEKKLAREPIVLPESPFWEVFRTFGRDELISLFINTAGTAVMAGVTANPLVLAVTGPIIEKIGFFLAYFKEARDIYVTTSEEKRESIQSYVSVAFRRGFASLVKDVAVHDPLYTLFMYQGLKAYAATPAWMLSILSFFAAVAIVAVGEVAVRELLYWTQIFRFKRFGFRLESYLESRFYIKDIDPKRVLEDLSREFKLKVKSKAAYQDRYFETNLKRFNARTPRMRFRKRSKEQGGWMQTIQIVYTRASEMARRKPTQFNYFPTRKDKVWITLRGEMPWEVAKISNDKLRKITGRLIVGEKFHDVFFERTVARDPKTILISTDLVNPGTPNSFTVVEIKSHLDQKSKTLLIEAMRFVMQNYPVIQTTHSKSDLTLPSFS